LLVFSLCGCFERSPVEPDPKQPGVVPIPFNDFGDGRDGEFIHDSGGTVLPGHACHVLLETRENGVVVRDWDGLATNRFMLWQTQDAFMDGVVQQDSITSADVLGDAGKWQLVEVVDAVPSGSTGVLLETQPAPFHDYSSDPASGRAAQVCTVPQFSEVAITSGWVAPTYWNGETGGVLALFVSGVLSLEGLLAVDGFGFRGGVVRTNGDGFLNTDVNVDCSSRDSGGKGEGSDGLVFGTCGRGNIAHSGGGGNSPNAGGGGGGGGGTGGSGGHNWQGDLNTRGMPGVGIDVSMTERLLMGGAGGAGHDTNVGATNGGDGGGVVLLLAQTITGGGSLLAHGEDTLNGGGGGGTGGGGGGGAIFVRVGDASTFTGSFDVRGGGAGIVTNLGPGGGGGGGRIRAEGISLLNITVELGGGKTDSTEPGRNHSTGEDGVIEGI